MRLIILLTSWFLLAACIGIAAAQRKGFSTVGGAVGGALLGPVLAPLLFLVSGTKCPYCAEAVRPQAIVCRHCHRDLAPFRGAA
jgi:hypothetical protein